MAKSTLAEPPSIFSRLQRWPAGWKGNGLAWIIAGAALALFIYGLVFVAGSSLPRLQYSANDIVYAGSLRAVHQMQAAGGAPFSPAGRPASGAAPVLLLSEQFYDFGTVQSPQVMERVFILANHGQSDLVIEGAYTTCGCTVADFTASLIPPGKVALMTVHFDTGFHDLRGTTVRRGVILQTNDPEHPQQEIWIQATIR